MKSAILYNRPLIIILVSIKHKKTNMSYSPQSPDKKDFSTLRISIWLFIAIVTVLAPYNLTAQDQGISQHYKIYDTQQHKEITFPELVHGLGDSDVVFFGEEHNDSIAHMVELALLQQLHESEKPVALSLEMFQSDTQLVLDEYLLGLIKETNLAKDGRLWNNYKDYRPLVEYAKEYGIPTLAANAPSRYTNLVTRSGLGALPALSETAKSFLAPLPIDTLTGPYHEKFAGLMGGHDGMGDLKIYQSQNLWDATMAFRISQFAEKHPKATLLHLNGRFHSDEHLGTLAQLKKYAPTLKSTNISVFSHPGFDDPDWDSFSHLADYVILTDPSLKRTF